MNINDDYLKTNTNNTKNMNMSATIKYSKHTLSNNLMGHKRHNWGKK
jgi:hypothetical protein